jgi:RimJ/RimL family protein N-acetyltransferase
VLLRRTGQPSTAAVQEGLLREFARKGDAFHDVVMMALLRKEWPPAQKLDRPGTSIATQRALS